MYRAPVSKSSFLFMCYSTKVFSPLITALELAKAPRKNVPIDSKNDPEIMKNVSQQSKGKTLSHFFEELSQLHQHDLCFSSF